MALDTTKHDVNRTTTGIKLPQDVLNEVWQSTIAASFVMNHARRMSVPGTGTNVNIITGDRLITSQFATAPKRHREPREARRV